MIVPKAMLAALLLGCTAAPALAALPFTCSAKGDTWTIAGTPPRPGTCTVACLLTDPAGDHDRVVCTAKVSGAARTDPLCEGFELGRRWTGAEMVTGQCSYDAP